MPAQGLAEITKLLEGRSRIEVRAICIEALRRWHRDDPSQRVVAMHGAFGLYACRLMIQESKASFNENDAKEPFLYNQADPALAPVMEFVWWLVRAALAIPELHVLKAVGSISGGGIGQHAAQVLSSGQSTSCTFDSPTPASDS